MPRPLRATLPCLLALAFATPVAAVDEDLELHWLAGHWCGMQDGADIEALWLDRGGQLLGLATTTRDGALESFEYARIEARAGGVVYVAQPGGEAPVEFALVTAGAQRLDFENPDLDFPQRVSLRRDDAGLHVALSGLGDNGEQRTDTDYVACADAGAATSSR